jgi:site-specific DNA recombinase
MATAVIYFRVSDERQVDGTSLQTQQEQCEVLVARNGWELDSAWAEEGESAKTANRPVLQAMLRYCHKHRNRIDFVVFPKIDRMARYLADYLRVKEQLAADGIRMVSVGEKIDESAAGRFTENIMAAQAQFDNEQRAERCKGGMEAAVKREGRWVWKAPFGYENRRVAGRPNIAPSGDAAAVTWAFREVAAGHAPDEVFAKAEEPVLQDAFQSRVHRAHPVLRWRVGRVVRADRDGGDVPPRPGRPEARHSHPALPA